MVNLVGVLVGPLAGPECRRAVARGWLIAVRSLAAVAVLGAVMLALWIWYIQSLLDPTFRPYHVLRIGLVAIEGMLVAIALVLSPAVIAGSLAGERERGALGLLLTTRVSPREVVCGRLAGKLSQVAMILLGGVPGLMGLASLAGFSPAMITMMLLFPLTVAFGAGGLAAMASVLSRRGRDALLSVYLVEVVLMLAPLLANYRPAAVLGPWLPALNPFVGLMPLGYYEEPRLAMLSMALWLPLGLAGTIVASWRLRPSCLRAGDGVRVGSRRVRRAIVPPVYEDSPMVWKELFIERVGTLGRFGKWAGRLLVLLLIGGSGVLAAVAFRDPFTPESLGGWGDWARAQLEIWVGDSGAWLACLIEWAIGLRAAVSISSERERGTWDALLTSPLDGREIVRGKLRGSLFAIKWLILAALTAWGLSAAVGAVKRVDAATWAVEILVVGAFMAAVGVRTSLTSPTATRAMALTIGVWLGAWVVARMTGFLLLACTLLIGNAIRMAVGELGLLPPQTTIWAPLRGAIAWPAAFDLVYIVATLLIVADTRLRFDRLAGRMTEGRAAIAFEEMVHGRPEAPVLIEEETDEDAGALEGIAQGLEDVRAGRTQPLDEAFAEIRRDLDLPMESKP